jgi:hypothetical protein
MITPKMQVKIKKMNLIKMLETADTINLIHEDGFTILNK